MTHTFRPQGVCSQQMKVELDEQGIIQELQVKRVFQGLGSKKIRYNRRYKNGVSQI